jgi:hypothetical protein
MFHIFRACRIFVLHFISHFPYPVVHDSWLQTTTLTIFILTIDHLTFNNPTIWQSTSTRWQLAGKGGCAPYPVVFRLLFSVSSGLGAWMCTPACLHLASCISHIGCLACCIWQFFFNTSCHCFGWEVSKVTVSGYSWIFLNHCARTKHILKIRISGPASYYRTLHGCSCWRNNSNIKRSVILTDGKPMAKLT